MKKHVFAFLFAFLNLVSLTSQAQCGSGATIAIQESRCVATGAITVSNVSGVGPFTYNFISFPVTYTYTGPTSSNEITALNPGNYVLRIIDAGNGNCFTNYPITIPGNYTQPGYVVTPTAVTNCIQGTNGSISGVLTGGRPPYTYQIIAGPCCITNVNDFSNTTGTFTNLSAGTYSVRGYDSCGNFQTRQATISAFTWNISTVTGSKDGCGSFSLNGVTLNQPGMTGVTYGVVRSPGDTIFSPTLPIAFTHPDNQLGTVRALAKDACGNVVTSAFVVSNNTSFSLSSNTTSKTSCPNQYSLTAVGITGNPFLPLQYGIVRTAGDTVWSASLPLVFTNTTNSARAVVKDACGTVQARPNQTINLTVGSVSRTYTNCTISSLTINASANTTFIGPLNYTLNPGAISQSSNVFTNLADGTYTVTITDACNSTATSSVVISHTWTSSVGQENACGPNSIRHFVAVPSRSIGPVTIEQYLLGNLVSTNTVSNTANANATASAQATTSSFFNITPGSAYTYVITDACGQTQTLNITSPAQGHQPNSMFGTVTPLCVNKGNVTFNYTSDLPSGFNALVSLWNINTPGTLITNNFNTGNRTGTYSVNNLDSGTYVLRHVPQNCPSEIILDTVTIPPYVQPSLTKSIALNCGANTINAIGAAKGGIPPYQYDIFQTFPTNNPVTWQSSPIFTLSGNYTLVRMRVVDACGNTSLQDLAVRPPAQPILKTRQKMPYCNLSSLSLYVDSVFPGAIYTWRNPAGSVVSNFASIDVPVTIADTGLYSCVVNIPGTCYIDTTGYRLRPKDFLCFAKLGDYVWLDVNQNGIQDNNEKGVAGVSVTLYNTLNQVISATETDANGYYYFDNILPSTYKVGVLLPSGYAFTQANQGANDLLDSDVDTATSMSGNYTILAGDSNLSIDAGIFKTPLNTASIGDKVWNDLNQNGIQDQGEPGVAGIQVTLFASDGVTIISSTLTNPSGNYIFTDLLAGDYVVGFGPIPVGFTVTTPNSGINDELDSDVSPLTLKSGVVSLANGDNNMSIDLGIYSPTPLASLGNFVWHDLNEDGVQDVGEPGVPGITVTLFNTNDSLITSTNTDANGNYLFHSLQPGTYYVEFSNLPSIFTFTGKKAGVNDELDSDADPINGSTDWVSLTAGQQYLKLDAGLVTLKASLGDYVWNDANKNGIQDINETGISGITVSLFESNGTTLVATAVTDADGKYKFVNLLPGTYVVGFSSIPSGALLSSANQGANDLVDSDPSTVTGKTAPITIVAGEFNPSIDAGIMLCTANAGVDKTINCTVLSVQIGTPSYPGATYLWAPSTGLSSTTVAMPIATPTSTTVYTLTVNGYCSDEVTVEVNKIPPTADAGATQNLDCTTTSATIGTTAIGGNTYAWSPATGLSATNIAQPTASPATTTVYTVTVTGSNGCTATSTVTVNVNTTIPTANAGSTQNLNCTITSATIGTTALVGNTYAWSPATGLSATNIAQPMANPTATTIYTVTVTGSNGCTATSIVTVNVNTSAPTADAGSTQNLDCTTTSATIGTTAIVGNSYDWSPATGLSATNIAQPIANPSATTTYTVTVTGANGCTATSTVAVNVNTTSPTADAGSTQNLDCTTTSATIGTTAIVGNTYSWLPATGLSATNIAQPIANPTATTIYTVTVTGANGCTATSTVTVNINTTTPTANAGTTQNLDCTTTSATIGTIAIVGNTYDWSPATGLSATNIAQPIANPSATTIYTITVTGSNGCTATSTVTVNINTTTPTADAGSTQNLDCTTTSATIGTTAIVGNSYDWSPATGLSATNIAQPIANPTATTIYTVTVTGANGCTATSTATVNVNTTSPTADAGSTQNLDCTTTSATIGTTAIVGNSYDWSPATGLSATNIAQPTANPSATTTYTVTVTGSNGCTATSTVTVNVNTTTPTADASSTQNLDCTTTSATIGTSAIVGNSYDWSPATGLSATNIAQPTANPSATTTYTVTVTGSNGCTATSTVTVNVNTTSPSADAGSTQNIDCTTTSATIGTTAIVGNSYDWSPAAGLSATNIAQPIANPLATTIYTVTVTGSNGCTATSTVIVNVNTTTPTADAGATQNLDCTTTSATMGTTAVVGNTYDWLPATGLSATNIAQPIANPTATTIYTVTVTGSNGCTATSTVTVNVNTSLPTADAGSTQNLDCITTGATIGTTAIGGNTYDWSPATGLSATNIAQPTANPSATTTYSVTVTGSNGCTATSTVDVNVNTTPPTADAGSTQNLDCTTTSATIGTTAIVGNSYDWSPATGLSATNIAQPIANPLATTIYTVTVTGSNGCTATSTVIVNVNTTTPTADAGATQNLDCTTTSATMGTTAGVGNTTTGYQQRD